MPETFDCIVVGGGAIGASIACHLAQRDFGRILLLERQALASGSTGRSVASVDLLTHHPAAVLLHLASLRAFQNCVETYGGECGWVETGFAVFAGPRDADGAREVVRVVSEGGGRIEILSPEAYRALDPACASDEGTALISWVPEGGHCDPALLTNTFAAAAKARGATVRQYDPALRLRLDGGRVSGVTVRQGKISAGAVVVATGPWTRDFLQRDGLPLPLQPQHHDAVLLDCSAEASPRASILDLVNKVYARPETGDLTVAGSLDTAVGYGNIEADDECPAPPLDYGLWVWERLVRRYPSMERGSLRKGWSGPTIISPDGQPLLGHLPPDGLYCATGFSGAGLKIAPAVGDLLAGLVAGEARAAEILHPFRPSRFAEGRPFVAQYSWGTIA